MVLSIASATMISEFNFHDDIGDGNPFSIAIWLNMARFITTFAALLDASDGTIMNYIHFNINNGDAFIGIGEDAFLTSGIPITLNTWEFIVLTYDGDVVKVYLNAGTPYERTIGSEDYSADDTKFGETFHGDFPFDGLVDEISFHDRVLSLPLIKSMMYRRWIPDSNTELCMPIDECTDGSAPGSKDITDISVNGNHGTVDGTTWNNDCAPVTQLLQQAMVV